MISLYTIFTFLIIHWIFDFFLQTDEMAKNKSKSNLALWEHINVYISGLCCMTVLNSIYFHNWLHVSFWLVVNSVAHFFTDYCTSQASSLLFKENDYHNAFVIIGADQMIHYITLFGTFYYFSNL